VVIGAVIAALTLLVVPVIFAGLRKLSFVRLSRRERPEKPVLVSAEPRRGGCGAVVNG
jgi:hypothetical protein